MWPILEVFVYTSHKSTTFQGMGTWSSDTSRPLTAFSRPLRWCAIFNPFPHSLRLTQNLRAAYNTRSLCLAQVPNKSFCAPNLITFPGEIFAFLFFQSRQSLLNSELQGITRPGCGRNGCTNLVSFFQQQLQPLVPVKALSRRLLSVSLPPAGS